MGNLLDSAPCRRARFWVSAGTTAEAKILDSDDHLRTQQWTKSKDFFLLTVTDPASIGSQTAGDAGVGEEINVI